MGRIQRETRPGEAGKVKAVMQRTSSAVWPLREPRNSSRECRTATRTTRELLFVSFTQAYRVASPNIPARWLRPVRIPDFALGVRRQDAGRHRRHRSAFQDRARAVLTAKNCHVEAGHGSGFARGNPACARLRLRRAAAPARHGQHPTALGRSSSPKGFNLFLLKDVRFKRQLVSTHGQHH